MEESQITSVDAYLTPRLKTLKSVVIGNESKIKSKSKSYDTGRTRETAR